MPDYFVEEPMLISDLELAELKSRTANSIRTKSSLANVEGYIEALKARIGKSGVSKVKAADTPTKYLYQLILQAEIMGVEIPAPTPEPSPVIEVTEVPADICTEDDVGESQAEEAPVKDKDHPEKHSKSKKGKRP